MLTRFAVLISIALLLSCCSSSSSDELKDNFKNPQDSAKPGVYWYFMDGNLSRKEMTKDLESMNQAGISNLIFLEVGIGVPRGPVDFMSEEWQDLFVHAVREAERLGIKILLGAGPGWCGSGGPWVKPEESMKHLVFSETEISGNKKVDIMLPVPEQRSTPWHKMKNPYYEDVAIYAIPNSAKPVIKNINEKALYERYPYSSYPNVKPHLPAPAEFEEAKGIKGLAHNEIIDVSDFLQSDGQFIWDAPDGNWTIVRMGTRITGAGTRPSPEPGIGLESDKLNATAFKNHLKNYTDILLEKTAPLKEGAGWTGLHIDSWESGSQNWTEGIVDEFKKRRGYDPEPYFLTYTGRAVKSIEISERFLWDLRLTCQELLLENHAGFAKNYAHKNGLELTIEPYDMNPAGDLDLGAVADVIMAEFWSKEYGFDTHYAVIEENIKAIKRTKGFGFKKVFLDDDFRLGNYPGMIGGCFCTEHKKEFMYKYGYSENAWNDLLHAIKQRDFTETLNSWINYNCDQLSASYKLMQASVNDIQIGNMLMYLGAEKSGIRLNDYKGSPLRVGELMFDDKSFGTVKGKTDELFSSLFHRRYVEPELAFSETTAYPPENLSAKNLAAKLNVSLISDVRNTMFMSGLTPFPRSYWSTLLPAINKSASLHGKVAGKIPRGPFKHYWGKASRYVGNDRPYSLFLAAGVPFEVTDKLYINDWTFMAEYDAKAIITGKLKTGGANIIHGTEEFKENNELTYLPETLKDIFLFKQKILPNLANVPYVVEELQVG